MKPVKRTIRRWWVRNNVSKGSWILPAMLVTVCFVIMVAVNMPGQSFIQVGKSVSEDEGNGEGADTNIEVVNEDGVPVEQVIREGGMDPENATADPEEAARAKYLEIEEALHDKNSLRQEERRNTIKDTCAASGKNVGPPHYEKRQFLVSDKFRFVVCLIPKAGYSFWRNYLSEITCGKKACPPEDKAYKLLSEYPDVEQEQILRDYFKAMFVRDPLDRLWSLYSDKFVTLNPFFMQKYGTFIIKKWRPLGRNVSKTCGHDTTFEEFLRYVKYEANNFEMNIQWKRYYDLCDPCHINYDLIGKIETFEEDFWEFQHHVPVTPKNVSVIVHKSATQLLEAAGHTFFLKQSKQLPKQCLQADIYVKGRWNSLMNRGFLDPGMSSLLQFIAFENTKAQQLERYNKFILRDLWSKLVEQTNSEEKALQIVVHRKKMAKNKAFMEVPLDLRDEILSVFALDYRMFAYSDKYSNLSWPKELKEYLKVDLPDNVFNQPPDPGIKLDIKPPKGAIVGDPGQIQDLDHPDIEQPGHLQYDNYNGGKGYEADPFEEGELKEKNQQAVQDMNNMLVQKIAQAANGGGNVQSGPANQGLPNGVNMQMQQGGGASYVKSVLPNQAPVVQQPIALNGVPMQQNVGQNLQQPLAQNLVQALAGQNQLGAGQNQLGQAVYQQPAGQNQLGQAVYQQPFVQNQVAAGQNQLGQAVYQQPAGQNQPGPVVGVNQKVYDNNIPQDVANNMNGGGIQNAPNVNNVNNPNIH